jgi:hypothetical protein
MTAGLAFRSTLNQLSWIAEFLLLQTCHSPFRQVHLKTASQNSPFSFEDLYFILDPVPPAALP